MRLRACLLAASCAALLVPATAPAQIRASEPASVSQTVDGTKLTVVYSRPRARGRSPLFGNAKVVRWDETWTPGANWATTLDVSRDVTLDGHPVPKGTYSVWLVVRRSGDWTFVLDPTARRFHMEPPDSAAGQVRFPVRAQSAPFTEVLTWSFPEVGASGGTLALQWGTTRVAARFEVQPSLTVTMPAADAQPYLGEYTVAELDSAGATRRTTGLRVLYESGTLKGEFVPNDPYMGRFALIRVAPDLFTAGLYDAQGRIYEVLRPEMMLTFTRAGTRAVSFEGRDDRDALWARGTRKP
jgi:hypothetical protein